jgi:hypothetical protein
VPEVWPVTSANVVTSPQDSSVFVTVPVVLHVITIVSPTLAPVSGERAPVTLGATTTSLMTRVWVAEVFDPPGPRTRSWTS